MAPPDPSVLTARAKACLAKAVPIPGAPLIHFGLAKVGLQSSFDALQEAVDYLACKAKGKIFFTDEEKTFLTEVFESLGIGGRLTGRGEAAALSTQYIKGNGAKLNIDPAVYQTSVIVKDAAAAIKDYVRTLIARKASFARVSSKDRGFMLSAEGKRLTRTAGRNSRRDGYLLDNGYLLAEQNNARLQKTNNRFVLASQNASLSNKSLVTRWSVDDVYEFEPFGGAHGDLYTEIDISGNFVLKLPDGLCHYMTTLGLAKAFVYSASWTEYWNE